MSGLMFDADFVVKLEAYRRAQIETLLLVAEYYEERNVDRDSD